MQVQHRGEIPRSIQYPSPQAIGEFFVKVILLYSFIRRLMVLLDPLVILLDPNGFIKPPSDFIRPPKLRSKRKSRP